MWSSQPLGPTLECGPASCSLTVPWASLFSLGQLDPSSPLRGLALVVPPPPPLHHFSALCICSHPGPKFFSSEIFHPRGGGSSFLLSSFFFSSVSSALSTAPGPCPVHVPSLFSSVGYISLSALELLEDEASFSIRPAAISRGSICSEPSLLGGSLRLGICLRRAGILCKNLLVPDSVRQNSQTWWDTTTQPTFIMIYHGIGTTKHIIYTLPNWTLTATPRGCYYDIPRLIGEKAKLER